MNTVRRSKALPSLCLHEMNLQFVKSADADQVKDILEEEPLLEVVCDP